MTEQISMFIPITKVNAQRREVWGWAAIEEPDNSDEILDYESSKPHFLDWSNRAQKRSGGKSLGNVRSMHQNVAAGKLIELRPDDVSKGFYVGAKIIDDNEWKKVESGVYTGFSVGGNYLKRWSDFRNPGKIRYTAKPTELSIVDSPCIPSATFEMLKMDGSKSLRKFKPAYGENTIMVVPASDRFIKVEWDESKHPRQDDGKFGSGGGGGGKGEQETIGSARMPERSPMKEIYGQNEPSESTRAKMRIQNMGANAKTNFARFKEQHPDKYEEALATYGRGGTSTEAIEAVMKPASGGGGSKEGSLVDSKYEGAAKTPSSRTNPTPKEVTDKLSSQSSGGNQAPASDLPKRATTWDEYNAMSDEDRAAIIRADRQKAKAEEAESKKIKIPGLLQQQLDDAIMWGDKNEIDQVNAKIKAYRQRKITKGDVVDKLERIFSILDDVEEELKKADVPESPEPITDIPLKGDYGSYEVEQMPAPNVLMELEANSEPSQEVLASHTVKLEDLTKAFEAWLPKVGKMVKSTVAEALAEAGVDLKKNSAPARNIRVITDKPNEEEYHG